MEMRLKLARGVKPTQKQALEIAQNVMAEPDMGWDWDLEANKPASAQGTVYVVEEHGDEAIYTYRVNLVHDLITILSIKEL